MPGQYSLDDFYQEGLRIRQGPYVMGAMTEFNMLWYRLPFDRVYGVHRQDAAVAFCKGYDDGYPPVVGHERPARDTEVTE